MIYNADGTLFEGQYTYNGVTYILAGGIVVGTAGVEIDYDGGGSTAGDGSTGGASGNADFVDTNQDGEISQLEQEIANLRSQLAQLTGASTTETSGMTREEIIAAINSAMQNYNSSNYDPLAFMNAFGFSTNPTFFGNTISTMSDDGVYRRQAVKDRDTGEIRYVNVPINPQGGINAYRTERRGGFGSLI